MLNATCLARAPFSPGTVTLALLSEPVHSGYESKSAITSMIAAGSAAMVSDCDEGVAMNGRLPRSTDDGCPPVGDVRPVSAGRETVISTGLRMPAESVGND